MSQLSLKQLDINLSDCYLTLSLGRTAENLQVPRRTVLPPRTHMVRMVCVLLNHRGMNFSIPMADLCASCGQTAKCSISSMMKAAHRMQCSIRFFGSNPFIIGKVLRHSMLNYRNVSLEEMNTQGYYTISFWNNGNITDGLHTVAVYFDGNVYSTYNLYGDGQVYYMNPSEYAYGYICGYYIWR